MGLSASPKASNELVTSLFDMGPVVRMECLELGLKLPQSIGIPMPSLLADGQLVGFRIYPDEDCEVLVHSQAEKIKGILDRSAAGNEFDVPAEDSPCDSHGFGLGLFVVHAIFLDTNPLMVVPAVGEYAHPT